MADGGVRARSGVRHGLQLQLASLGEPVAAPACAGSPTPDERGRAAGIASPLRRAQFLLGRRLLRQVLAQRYGGAPNDWPLSSAAGEPPRLLSAPGAVQLSIAHRAEWVAVAVSAAPVGIDIEVATPRSDEDLEQRAALLLAPRERDIYRATAAARRGALLRTLWTLKEAWCKACRAQFDLALLPELCAEPAPRTRANARSWQAGPVTLALAGEIGERAIAVALPRGMAAGTAQCWNVRPA